MKNIISFMVALMFMLSLTACGENSGNNIPSPSPAANPLPIAQELVRECVQEYLRLIIVGDTAELARFLLIDGGVRDEYVSIAERVIDYYSSYELESAAIQSIDYDATEQRYTIIVQDEQENEFTVYALYGDSLLGIDIRIFE